MQLLGLFAMYNIDNNTSVYIHKVKVISNLQHKLSSVGSRYV